MRPDAHKQKASTQYKKKHGLSSDKKADAGGRGGSRPKTGARETVDGGEAAAGGTVPTAGGQEGAGTGVSAATSHPMMVSAAPSFRRREVTSNWSRYEGLEDTQVDITTVPNKLRGADFGLLLRVASTSSSQFRFADEQDWEDDQNDPCSFLSVDCADLTAALRCEPLHVRLGLNTDTFSEDQIERFTAAAESHKTNYKRRVQSTVVTGLDDIDEPHLDSEGEDSECSPVPSDDDSEDDSAICRSAVTPQVTEAVAKKSAIKSLDITSPETLTQQVASALPALKSPESLIKASKPTPPVDSAEDDLDFLLSLEEPVKNEQEDTQEIENDALDKPCNPVSLEPNSDLPVLPEPQPQAKVTTTQTSTTNLEDWLDDFLDD